MSAERIPLNSLASGVASIRTAIDTAIARVLDRGHFVLGPEVEAFERAFAAYHGSHFEAVGVGSGTDALRIALQALGIGPGDEVLVVANAGVPPVAAVIAAGATPVFCDVDPESQTFSPNEIERRRTARTRAVLVVHLYGCVAAMEEIVQLARSRGLAVVEDCAQAHGARRYDRLAGTWGDAAAFSFYPTKNLGALGDGGALLTARADVAERARLLRHHGWRKQYLSELQSTNSRLDELQAAVLGAKLPHLDKWNRTRSELARLYWESLHPLEDIRLPTPTELGSLHAHHLYVIRVAGRRDQLRAYLTERGIGTGIHYPLPVHLQPPFACYGQGARSLPCTEQLAGEVLSLPMYPELSPNDVACVAAYIREFALKTESNRD